MVASSATGRCSHPARTPIRAAADLDGRRWTGRVPNASPRRSSPVSSRRARETAARCAWSWRPGPAAALASGSPSSRRPRAVVDPRASRYRCGAIPKVRGKHFARRPLADDRQDARDDPTRPSRASGRARDAALGPRDPAARRRTRALARATRFAWPASRRRRTRRTTCPRGSEAAGIGWFGGPDSG